VITRDEAKDKIKFGYGQVSLSHQLRTIDKIYEGFEKDSRELRDKLAKAQNYIVDLENQLKNKSNGWMNK
jgi:predicted  nucleic acid-binding Zn-ribbon protein